MGGSSVRAASCCRSPRWPRRRPRPAGLIPTEVLPGQVMAPAPGPAGPLHGVPALPTGYLERSELGSPRAAMLEAGSVGLTGDVPGLSMHGQGGIGKTGGWPPPVTTGQCGYGTARQRQH
jgi:hypothetical protein